MRAAVGATPETEEHHHDEPAADSHGDRLSNHLRRCRDVRQSKQACPKDRERANEHGSQRSASGVGTRGEVRGERSNGRDRQCLMVDGWGEPALRQDRFVEQADA